MRRDLPLAVAALRRLTRLTGLRLTAGILDEPHWDGGEWPRPVQLPPLAGLSALTALKLNFYALPPPDWRELASLRSLEWREAVDVGGAPLTGLLSLTTLSANMSPLPEPHHLATLPRLACLYASGASPEWRKQLSALLPQVKYIDPAPLFWN